VRLWPAAGAARRDGEQVTITLADGRRFERRAENGMLEPGELKDKFLRLTAEPSASRMPWLSSSACTLETRKTLAARRSP